MMKIASLILILTSIFCYAIQTGKPEVQIINGRDLFNDSARVKQDQKHVKDNEGKSFIIYTVENGDNWYSIAKKFGITYSELRLANKEDDKLIAGKTINIPTDKLKVNDPYYQKKHLDSVSTAANGKEEIRYHTVTKGQTLFSISKMYSISVELLKEWNGLTSNSITLGQKLIVGKTKSGDKPEKQAMEEKRSSGAVDITNSASNKTSGENEIILSSSKKPEGESVSPKNTKDKVEKENTSEVKKNIPVEKSEQPSNDSSGEKIIFANGRHEVNENGKALCMNEDDANMEKYYALHRTAPAGTIIRVMNKSNSKKIYVKVIGELPDNFENEGAIIKISKASAEKLGVNDKSFQVNLLYGVNKD